MKVTRVFESLAVLAAVGLGIPTSSAAQIAGADSSRPQVRTVATATRYVTPNLAVIRLNLVADGRTAREAGRHVAARADTLRRALTSLGIPRDSLATASEWYWWGGRLETIVTNGRFVQLPRTDSLGRMSYYLQDTTFRAHDAIEVRVHQIGKIGAVIDSALAHSVSDMSNVQFQASEVSAARDAALKAATDDARRQAESIAASSGMQLGRVISFSTYAEFSREFDMGLNSLSASGTGGGGTEIIPRSLPVSMTVYGQWELKARP